MRATYMGQYKSWPFDSSNKIMIGLTKPHLALLTLCLFMKHYHEQNVHFNFGSFYRKSWSKNTFRWKLHASFKVQFAWIGCIKCFQFLSMENKNSLNLGIPSGERIFCFCTIAPRHCQNMILQVWNNKLTFIWYYKYGITNLHL